MNLGFSHVTPLVLPLCHCLAPRVEICARWPTQKVSVVNGMYLLRETKVNTR